MRRLERWYRLVPTSIALVEPFVYTVEAGFRNPDGTNWSYKPLTVRPHRYSWKRPAEGPIPNVTTEAECIAFSSDHWKFQPLHSLLGQYTEAALVAVAERFDEDEDDGDYPTMLPVLREMAEQHPDAMWFVG